MSGVAVIRYKLANDAPLIAVVAAAKIVAGIAPINTVLPAISVSQVSGVEWSTIKRGATGQFITERVQVTVHGRTYAQKKQIIGLIRNALTSTRGTVNGVSVDSIVPDVEGPDM